jgi:hypothetical protein
MTKVLPTDADDVIQDRTSPLDIDVAPEVVGVRDDPEEALANLLAALDTLGVIVDATTVS